MHYRTLIAAVVVFSANAQTVQTLTLAQAEEIAVRNHPRISSASLNAKALGAAVKEVRSAEFPKLVGNVTGVGADSPTTLSAGALTTSSIYNRGATGITVNQLITDFGRTSNLTESARLRAAAQNQTVNSARAQVLLAVQQSYFQALAAQAVLKVAQATVQLRELTLRQVRALAQSALKSTLDVSFAEVNLSDAQLALFRAENDLRANHARLAAALGYERDPPFDLSDEPLPAELPPDPEILVTQALQNRPDLSSLQLSQSASERFAEAEKRLRYPSVSAVAAAGIAPVRDPLLPRTYSGTGINVSIPFLNGGLFNARRTEAEFRAQAAGKDVQDLAIQVARDVRVAWLDANDALRRLDLTQRLVAQSNEALRLAQARYDLGLSGIVELNQALLNQTSAQITAAGAKYEYLTRRSALEYATGSLR